MKKIFKGLLTTTLAVGFLAGCFNNSSSETPPSSSEPSVAVNHLVEFYADNRGAFYLEVEVPHGTAVARPNDPPVRATEDFIGWYVDAAYSAEFDFATLIVEDTTIFGQWEPKFVNDERDFHVVGGLENTDITYINWQDSFVEGAVEGDDNYIDPRSYLTKDDETNLYSIELEVGYLGKFKVKIPGRPWDSDTEFNFSHIREEDARDYLKMGDSSNIQVTDAGLYLIEVETRFNYARVTRLGDATGEGVKPTPEPGTILDWGIVGTLTGWGADLDISLGLDDASGFYAGQLIYFPEGAEWKLRADNSWGVEFGSHVDNVYPTDKMVSGTEVVEEEEVVKEGANITVLVGGLYTVIFDSEKIIVEEVSFGLRGDALAAGWDADTLLELASVTPKTEKEGEVDVVTELTYVFEGTFTVSAGGYKVKHAAAIIPGDTPVVVNEGWGISFGDGIDNIAITAGTYDFVFTFVYDVVEGTYTGSVVSTVAVA